MLFIRSLILNLPAIVLLLISTGAFPESCFAGEESSLLICQNNTNSSYNTPPDAFANANGQYANNGFTQGQDPNNQQNWGQQTPYSGSGQNMAQDPTLPPQYQNTAPQQQQQQYMPAQGYPSGQNQAQNSQYPTQNSQYPNQNSQYPNQNSQNPAQNPTDGQYSDPTYYGYANDIPQSNYPNQNTMGQNSTGQPPTQQINGYTSQVSPPEQNNQSTNTESGSGTGSKLMQAGRALAGLAVPLATGYFLTKAANRQARMSGYPNGYGTYGTPYGYNMAPGAGMMNPYGGYGGGYGNAFGNPYGGYGMSPMGGGLLNMFGQ